METVKAYQGQLLPPPDTLKGMDALSFHLTPDNTFKGAVLQLLISLDSVCPVILVNHSVFNETDTILKC